MEKETEKILKIVGWTLIIILIFSFLAIISLAFFN
jgi:hypothetical protein